MNINKEGIKMYIYAMSRKLKDIGADLNSKAQNMILHLIKVILYPHHTSQNHWFQEIYASLNKVDLVKGKNRTPKSEFIYNNLIKGHSYYINSYIRAIIKDYGESEFEISYDDILFYVQEYCRWLSLELSQNGFVSRTDAYNHLNDVVKDVKSNFAN